MDVTRSDVVKDEAALSPQEPQKKSLLMRFLTSTARRRSQTNSGGSTVSRLTDDEPDLSSNDPQPLSRRATIDLDLPGGRKHGPGSPTIQSSTSPAGLSKQNDPRRATMELSLSNISNKMSSRNLLNSHSRVGPREEYVSLQAHLQKKADDYHKGGQLQEAIDVWLEALALAEEHKDTLTKKMEVLCILLDLHLQMSQQQEREETTDQEEADILSRFHRQAAKRYVHRLKPAIVKPSWLGPPSVYMMDFFCEAEAWELALLVAEQLIQEDQRQLSRTKPSVDFQRLATMHFQVASQKLDSRRQGEALQHLQATVEHLKKLSNEERDMIMYMQVLHLLATEYNAQGQYNLALDAYEEQLKHAPSEKQASLYCQMARIYISIEDLDLALEKLQLAAAHMEASESSIRFELLQTKGDVFFRLGRMEESLKVHEQALKEAASINPAETAKLLYTLGRLCVRLGRIRPAISYFSRELEITIQELGMTHLSVSRVLHELAKLYDEGLGEPKVALLKLSKALSIELAVLQECHYAVTQCAKCNPVTHRMCSQHALLQHDVSAQIRETKKCQGRIHFKLGNFEKALKTSFNENTAGRR
jgi:tetratricopeptide (TPR) repeat protein